MYAVATVIFLLPLGSSCPLKTLMSLTIAALLPTGAATNRLITAKDHSSVQINIAEVDEQGKMITGKNVSYAFSGYVRSIGEADDSLNMLATQDGRK